MLLDVEVELGPKVWLEQEPHLQHLTPSFGDSTCKVQLFAEPCGRLQKCLQGALSGMLFDR